MISRKYWFQVTSVSVTSALSIIILVLIALECRRVKDRRRTRKLTSGHVQKHGIKLAQLNFECGDYVFTIPFPKTMHIVKTTTAISVVSFACKVLLSQVIHLWELKVFGSKVTSDACEFKALAGSFLFLTGKFAMYSMLVARVHIAFGGEKPTKMYSARTFYLLFFSLIIFYAIGIVLLPLSAHSRLQETDYAIDGRTTHFTGSRHSMTLCRAHYIRTDIGFVFVGFIDLFYNAITALMFAIPLHRIAKKCARRKRSTGGTLKLASMGLSSARVHVLPLKYMVTSGVIVCSTLVAFALTYALDSDLFTSVLCVVNMTCLILMTRDWEYEYWLMCAPLVTCLANSENLAPEYKMPVAVVTHGILFAPQSDKQIALLTESRPKSSHL